MSVLERFIREMPVLERCLHWRGKYITFLKASFSFKVSLNLGIAPSEIVFINLKQNDSEYCQLILNEGTLLMLYYLLFTLSNARQFYYQRETLAL